MNTVYGQTGDWRALGGVAALHAVAVLGLLSVEPVAQAVGLPQPLMVSLLSAAEPPKEPPKPIPPKPRVQQVQPVQPPPVLAVREEAPTPVTVQAPPPEPVPVPVVLPAPHAPEPAKPVAVAAVAASAPSLRRPSRRRASTPITWTTPPRPIPPFQAAWANKAVCCCGCS
jgi:outer membrane biosynthesis protein TonB